MMRADSPFLANKRVFAVPTTGLATSVKCDQNGFVYAGCSGGIEVWNSGGMLQAVIEIPGKSNASMTIMDMHSCPSAHEAYNLSEMSRPDSFPAS